MTMHLGNIPASTTLYIPFATYAGATGASITLTGLAVTDIEIYKNGSTTQRASDNGYALLDTDGIDFDGITGIHGFSVDLADNSDAGFYAVGGFYWVVVSAVTVDGQTVNFIAATFRLVVAENTAGYPVTDTGKWNNLATVALPLIPTVAGRTLDVSAGGEAGMDWGNVGSPTTTVGLSGTTVKSATDIATDVAAVKSDTAAILVDTGTTLDAALAVVDANVDAILVDTGTTLQAELDAIEAAVITNAAGVDIAADIIALKAETAAILVDTGTTLQAELDGIQADTEDIQARIPTALSAAGNIKADGKEVNDVTLQGAGTAADSWRPV